MKALLLIFVVCASAMNEDDAPIVTDELVNAIHSRQSQWRASVDQGALRGATRKEIKRRLGYRPTIDPSQMLPHKVYPASGDSLPDSFDAAVAWPHCSTINTIRDQADCGSCWAVSVAEAISDRYCTYSTTPENVTISALNILSCCINGTFGNGCDGGQPSAAWWFWIKKGLVDDACDPYQESFPHCEAFGAKGDYPPCPEKDLPVPKCTKTCKNNETWSKSLRNGLNAWTLKGEDAFKQELVSNGPFEVSFTVYDDFVTYKSGVYSHTTGKELGGHAVKVVGYGTLDDTPYWKIANSWNPDWGADGFFLIERGSNECGIENAGTAGQP
jgi:cysteine peptidase C